ncbi:hypothetical protein ACQPYK_49690 (plasmid) [Streptosporangium sp. CA-135522]|uniref:hypothetical protein n=1 Tax=Streptosporangium sp. CA-135522 TaxID=3240072 RepID=UPI003D8AEA5F
MPIKCGNCSNRHFSVTSVRMCYQYGGVLPCDWLIDTRRYTEDGEPIIVACGADAWTTDRGWRCAAGHEHVSAEVRDREGWDYVTEDEAEGFARNTGRVPVLMNGHPWVP